MISYVGLELEGGEKRKRQWQQQYETLDMLK